MAHPSEIHRTPSADVDTSESSSIGKEREMEDPDGYPKEGKHIDYGQDNETAAEAYNLAMIKAIDEGTPLPEMPGAPPQTQLTLRALIVGSACGGLIGASSIYLGLKSGNAVGGGSFATLVGFAALNAFSKWLPVIPDSEQSTWEGHTAPFWVHVKRFFKLGGYFGVKEHISLMSAASAAASNTVIFYSAVPAIFQLKLLPGSPKQEIGKLFALSAVCCYWGMFFAVPFRRLYLIDQNLPFPGAIANAVMLRTLHTMKGTEDNKRRIRSLVWSFIASFLWKMVCIYAPGILYNHHPFWAFYLAGSKHAIEGDNWGWYLTWSPAYIGVGMIIGINATTSILGGQIVAWGIVGPALVATNAAVGAVISAALYPGWITYQGITPGLGPRPPSPRYWLVWPGTLLIMVCTFVEIGCNSKEIYNSLAGIFCRFFKIGDPTKLVIKEDPAPPNQRIPWWMWLTGTVLVAICTCAVLAAQFGQKVGTAALAVFATLLFSFMTIESVGRVSIAGVSVPLTQVLFYSYTTGQHLNAYDSMYANTMASAVSLAASQQIADMVEDLKLAHLSRASPRMIFFSQLFGAIIATFLVPALFVMFADSNPCILTADPLAAATCSFPVPSAAGYRAMALLAGHTMTIPLGSGLFALLLSLLSAVTIIARHKLWIPKKYHPYLPSWIAIGVGLMLPNGNVGIAFWIGGLITKFWRDKHPINAALFLFPIASGMMAGEGTAGVLGAALEIGGVGGSQKGTLLGCPFGFYCG